MPRYALDNISKRFGAVQALDRVSLDIAPGEIHVLLGENGAGKSTLMQVLFGLYQPDAGDILVDGQKRVLASPADAAACGIGMVQQECALVPTLNVMENVTLGLRTHGLFPDWRAIAAELRALAARNGLAIDPHTPVERLSMGERQRAEILKLLYRRCDLLILDEPTAILTPTEVAHLFAFLKGACAEGRAVLLVTHKLSEIAQIADVVTVMRRGAIAGTHRSDAIDTASLARAMLHDLNATPPAPRPQISRSPRLSVSHLALPGHPDGVGFKVARGEILGIAGVDGNGQAELADALAGLRSSPGARITLDGHHLETRDIAQRRRAGVAYIPADRNHVGSIADADLTANATLGRRPGFYLAPRQLRAATQTLLARAGVVPADPRVRAGALSGGNKQKLIVAREIAHAPRLLICAYPTRGVDTKAAAAIWAEIEALRDRGCAIVLISADLDEILARSDRIAVLCGGRMTQAEPRDAIDAAALGRAMAGLPPAPTAKAAAHA